MVQLPGSRSIAAWVSVFALGALGSGCATTRATSDAMLEPSTNEEAPLPNGSMQTARPMVPGEELTGILGCGQVAWYRLSMPDARPITVHILGQAQEHSLGATATLSVHAPTGEVMGQLLIPVFARSPNWDPREQPFAPPAPGVYFASVRLDPNGCQRVAFRLALR
jgi:hypothetical protein